MRCKISCCSRGSWESGLRIRFFLIPISHNPTLWGWIELVTKTPLISLNEKAKTSLNIKFNEGQVRVTITHILHGLFSYTKLTLYPQVCWHCEDMRWGRSAMASIPQRFRFIHTTLKIKSLASEEPTTSSTGSPSCIDIAPSRRYNVDRTDKQGVLTSMLLQGLILSH